MTTTLRYSPSPFRPTDNVPRVTPTAPASALISLDHEELVIRKGRRSGVYTIVAVHSTTLGPALGGCRMWRYESSADAARDALRLSRAMTFKAAAAGLALGGGKSVISLPPGPPPTGRERRAILEDFADTVSVLEGAYVTAEDVGTSSRDMSAIAESTRWVTGLPRSRGGSGDPSPFTALGVEAAMRASCQRVFGSGSLKGRTVSVVGAGRVGSHLARLLSRAGAKLLLADIDEGKKALTHELKNTRWTDPTTALLADVDIVAPCALGGAVDGHNIGRLRAQIICGSANNQLAHEGLGEDLAARGILYAPDFIANAGGLINVATELDPEGYDLARTKRRVLGIEETMTHIYDEAEHAGVPPIAAAYTLARRRLAEAGTELL
jgi:leucine dehydrogenase